MALHAQLPPCPMLSEPRLHSAQALLLAGHPHQAAERCARLLGQAQHTTTPGWKAAFGALRAESLLCLGDVAEAGREAATAVRAAPPGSALALWPVAVLAQTLTETGRHQDADRHLSDAARGPLPSTAYALPYLRARGRHRLAVRRPADALADFRRTGELMNRRDAGPFSHLPWRTDAAEALLGLGRYEQAAELISQQLAGAPALGPRYRGIALCLLAATEEPARRPATLAQAIAELRACADRLELARALAGLGGSLHDLGDDSTAGGLLRRARHLAADCGAAPLC
jgi:tetratricopeptide (TPR) repeat protein